MMVSPKVTTQSKKKYNSYNLNLVLSVHRTTEVKSDNVVTLSVIVYNKCSWLKSLKNDVLDEILYFTYLAKSLRSFGSDI